MNHMRNMTMAVKGRRSTTARGEYSYLIEKLEGYKRKLGETEDTAQQVLENLGMAASDPDSYAQGETHDNVNYLINTIFKVKDDMEVSLEQEESGDDAYGKAYDLIDDLRYYAYDAEDCAVKVRMAMKKGDFAEAEDHADKCEGNFAVLNDEISKAIKEVKRW